MVPRAIKKLGQHFLKKQSYVNKEVEAAELSGEETVLEIGPGTGILTEALLQKAKKVIAVELDKRMIEFLEARFKKEIENGKLQIMHADILKTKLPAFDKCVSNIPYQISSSIIELLAACQKPAVLIMQKEFAERLVAEAGERDYSRLTVLANFHFIPMFIADVPRSAFSPEPKVDSAIVKLVPRNRKPPVDDEGFFFLLVKALFVHRNQKVAKSFFNSRHFFGLGKEKAKPIARELEQKTQKKVYETPIYELAELSNWLKERI